MASGAPQSAPTRRAGDGAESGPGFVIEVRRDDLPIAGTPLATRDYRIGGGPTCDIVIPGPDVEPEHARLESRPERLLLFRLTERGRVTVSGRDVGSTVVKLTDVIGIGAYTLRFVERGKSERFDLNALRVRLHQALVERLDLAELKIEQLSDEALWKRCRAVIAEIIGRSYLPDGIDKEELQNDVLHEALGLGPLENLLADDSVTEIMVNGKDRIFVERHGLLAQVPVSFTSDEQVVNVIRRIVSPIGRRIDQSSPLVDGRLADGSRVNAVIPPLAIHGPSLTIRKFAKKRLTGEDLVGFGSLTENMAAFLKFAVEGRRSMVISGGTGSGKTTLLNVLSNFIPIEERVVTVEDSAELKLAQVNLVSLEARPENIEGAGAITIRDLVKNALRMRPDRIVVGECRGGEALDMLQAMNTGHDGSLTTLHANSPEDALLRLETLVMMSGFELPIPVIRRQAASAIQLIVQQARLTDGSRKITHVTEVLGTEGDEIKLRDVFVFRQTGLAKDGKVLGHFTPTGVVPRFVEEFAKSGRHLPLEIFKPVASPEADQSAA